MMNSMLLQEEKLLHYIFCQVTVIRKFITVNDIINIIKYYYNRYYIIISKQITLQMCREYTCIHLYM